MYGRTLLNNYTGRFAGGTVHRCNAVTALSVRACDNIDNYPRRARSALGVDIVLTLDVCMFVCLYVCMLVL